MKLELQLAQMGESPFSRIARISKTSYSALRVLSLPHFNLAQYGQY